jgi:peptide/nickel transport system ATP-binding protein
MVMFQSKIVEQGPTSEIFERPTHLYTQHLLAARPIPNPDLQCGRHAAVPWASNARAIE